MSWCGNHLDQSEPSSDQPKAGLLVLCGDGSSQSLRELFWTPSCHSRHSFLAFPGPPLNLCFLFTQLRERGHHLPAWQDLRHICTHVVLTPFRENLGAGTLYNYIPLLPVYLMILSTHWQSSNHGTLQLVHKDNQLLLLFLPSDPLTFWGSNV